MQLRRQPVTEAGRLTVARQPIQLPPRPRFGSQIPGELSQHGRLAAQSVVVDQVVQPVQIVVYLPIEQHPLLPGVPRRIAKTQVLVLDDWGLSPLSAEHRHDLLEVLEDRHGVRSTIVTSQLPVEKWHDVIGDPTFADAILDRLVHNAYRLDLKGDSMRKRRRPSARREHSEL